MFPGPHGFSGAFYHILKKNLYHFYEFFQKGEEVGTLSKTFNKGRIILVIKPEKDTIVKEN